MGLNKYMSLFCNIKTLISLSVIGGLFICCTCIGESTTKASFENSDMVFSGRVLEKEVVSSAVMIGDESDEYSDKYVDEFLEEWDYVKCKIQLERVFKGKSSNDQIIVYTPNGSDRCEFKFKKHKKYIVYGDYEPVFGGSNKAFLLTNECDRTQKFMQEERKKLLKLSK